MSSLAGQTVVVCRPQHQSLALVKALETAGGTALILPLLEVTIPSDGGAALDEVLNQLSHYDWVTFTSTNAVHAVIDKLKAPWPERTKVAAVGPGTADLLRQSGYPVNFVSAGGTAADLAATLPVQEGQHILAPLGDRASSALETGLTSRGAVVSRVVAYRTMWTEVSNDLLEHARTADFVFLTSPAIAERFSELVGRPGPRAICIGPTTASAAENCELDVAAVATIRTPDGLIDALMRTLQS